MIVAIAALDSGLTVAPIAVTRRTAKVSLNSGVVSPITLIGIGTKTLPAGMKTQLDAAV